MQNNAPTKFKAVFKLNQADENHKFQPLPAPTGPYPYRLKFEPADQDQLVFHVVGDTGGIYETEYRHRVSSAMIRLSENSTKPDFLYHLGDIVYNFGEEYDYARQFFKPYEEYPAPVFAIAGNHDSDVNPLAKIPYQSLDAFVKVFCNTSSVHVPFANGSARKSNTQPHVYWTMDTPLAVIIGMHSNVPKYGIVTDEQRAWLIEELKWADVQRPGKALIIAIHHAPYSADINHGSSLPMIELLENAFAETGIRPDLVMSGHVHNYQRFERAYDEGKPVTYLVAGAGGYEQLHTLAEPGDPYYSADSDLLNNIFLQAYEVKKYGFVRLGIRKEDDSVLLTGEYHCVSDELKGKTTLVDKFSLHLG